MFKSANAYLNRASFLGSGPFREKKSGAKKRKATVRSPSGPPIFAKADLKHFVRRDSTAVEFVERLGPLLKQIAREGVRKPKDVSDLLNQLKKPTACGDLWTPRRVALALGLLFDGKVKTDSTKTRKKLGLQPAPASRSVDKDEGSGAGSKSSASAQVAAVAIARVTAAADLPVVFHSQKSHRPLLTAGEIFRRRATMESVRSGQP